MPHNYGAVVDASCLLRVFADTGLSVCHKVKTIIEQCDTRETHFKSLLRHRDTEIQNLSCKYEEQRRIAENEIARGRALSAQVSTFSHTEAELRSQLNIYVEKFKQVCKSPALITPAKPLMNGNRLRIP